MSEISEINDPRIVKGLAHPLRIHILGVLQERTASPSEIAAQCEASLGTVSYHVRYLERIGLIKLTETKPRRGAVEHYYRAVGRLRISDRAWAQVPTVIRDSLVGSTLDQIGRIVTEAAAAGGFSREHSRVARQQLRLDDQGFHELSLALRQLNEQAERIERESIERLAVADQREAEVAGTMVLMLFDQGSPVSETAVAGPGELPEQAAASPAE